MLEQYKNNRLKFNIKGVQRNFILKAKELLGLTSSQLSKRLHISQRTLADWTREKISISQATAQTISKLANMSIPVNHSIIDWRIRFKKAGEIGGRNKFLKYGSVCIDEKYRKEKWQEWWNKTGQYKKNPKGFQSILKIKIPKKSRLLAEFFGILLGDGNISVYNIGVTLSSEEKQYINYVCKVIKKLFGVLPKIFKHKSSNAVSIIVNRKQLVDFCQEFGFKMGNKVKHQVDIPLWIKENAIFSRECIRGLIDTDGCFFFHKYMAGGKIYSYLKIAFTSASRPLTSSVAEALTILGFNVRVSKNGKDVRIEDKQYVQKYIKEIGSHNQKHLEKIRKWKKSNSMLE